MNSNLKMTRIYDSSVDFQTLALSGPFQLDVHVNRASYLYQPGAPAALPGKTFFANDQKSAKNSDIYKENLGPPVVGPCFSRMLGFGANNSTDTNKNKSSFSFKERLDEKYISITQIKIQARKEWVHLGKFLVTGSCDDKYKLHSNAYRCFDLDEAMQEMNLYPWTTSLLER